MENIVVSNNVLALLSLLLLADLSANNIERFCDTKNTY